MMEIKSSVKNQIVNQSNTTVHWSADIYADQPTNLSILIESHQFDVHKDTLVQCSDYFRAMFSSQMIENTRDVITLHMLNPEAFRIIIEGFYTSKLNLTEENIFGIIETAQVLILSSGLHSQCMDFLKDMIDFDSVFDIINFSSSNSSYLTEIFNVSKKFSLTHFMELKNRNSFLSLTAGEVCDYLSEKSLVVDSEVSVMKALNAWFKTNQVDKLTLQNVVTACVSMKEDNKALDSVINCIISGNFMEDNKDYNLALNSLQERSKHHNVLLFWSKLNTTVEEGLVDVTQLSGESLEGFKFDTMTDVEQNPGYDLGSALCCLGPYVYLCGGGPKFGGVNWIRKIWKFDPTKPSSQRWTSVGVLEETRRHHSMVAVENKLYIFGGFGKFRMKNSKLESFDLQTGSWDNLPAMPVHEINPVVTVVHHSIYFLDRSWGLHCYQPQLQCWTTSTWTAPSPHVPVALYPDPNNTAGFFSLSRGEGKFYIHTLLPATQSHTTVCEAECQHCYVGSVLVRDEMIMLFGSSRQLVEDTDKCEVLLAQRFQLPTGTLAEMRTVANVSLAAAVLAVPFVS
ncbi:kelch-like protein 12 [Physella acuta]|uniref:kelch-like protein 12 n=1 Tax=Physella acuta TaxID=109671 RepID=UPI0027DCF02C|nr:kelch-like protein 12 [Physella acuta]